MNLNKSIHTDLIREIEEKYTNAASLFQEIWMHGSELYMDEVTEPPITEEEVAFLQHAYLVIKSRGENISAYTEDELFQVQAMLVSSICLNRSDLIVNAGISEGFLSIVESKLRKLGYSF